MVISQVKKSLSLIFCMTFSLFVQAQELDSLIFNTIVTDLQTIDSLYAEYKDSATVDSIIVAERPYRIDTLGSYWLPLVDSLICYAESYYGSPYHYGSKGPNSFDCSGFTGFVFSHFGIQLPSSSTYQFKEAPFTTECIDSVRQGDLIFFMGRNGRKSVGHVGIVIDVDTANHSCRFIHAATHGGVIATKFPSYAYYNQRFMGFGRYELPEFLLYYKTEKIYLDETIENTSDGE